MFVSILLAFILTASVFGMYGLTFQNHSVVFYVMSYAMYQLICRSTEVRDRRVLLGSAVFSLVMTVTYVAGSRINISEKPYFTPLAMTDWIWAILLSGVVFVCTLNAVVWILNREIRFVQDQQITKKFWAKAFGILMLLWLPYFLMFYPGNLSMDSLTCVRQAIGDLELGYNHPAAFAGVVSVFIHLGLLIGDINFAIACYTFAQMLTFAAILSYVLYWLRKDGAPEWVVILTGAYFGLNPMIATFSVTIWKDVMFSAFLLLLTVWLYDVCWSKGQVLTKKSHLAVLFVAAVFLSLWRNGIVAGIYALTAILLVCYKKYARYFLPVCLVALLIISLVLGPVYTALDIPDSNKAETFGIMLQQVGYTLEQGGEIDAQCRDFLNQILPEKVWIRMYTPGGADDVKFHTKFNHEFFNQNIDEFLSVWLKMLPKNLKYYIRAWQMNTLGYYHLDTTAVQYWVGIIPVERAEELGIFRTDLIDRFLGIDIPGRAVEAFLFLARKLPVFTSIYCIAVSVWLFALFLLICILRKNTKKTIWGMLPLAILWVTLMFTVPVYCEFRYMFLYHLAIPLMVIFMFRKFDDNEETADTQISQK